MQQLTGTRVTCIREEYIGIGEMIGASHPAAFALVINSIDRWERFAIERRNETAFISIRRFQDEAFGLIGRTRIEGAIEDGIRAGLIQRTAPPDTSKQRAMRYRLNRDRFTELLTEWLIFHADGDVLAANQQMVALYLHMHWLKMQVHVLISTNACIRINESSTGESTDKNKQENLTDQKQVQASDDAAAADDAIQKIMEIGLSEKRSSDLVAEYGPDRCKRQIPLIEKRGASNPVGFLIAAIKGDFAPEKRQRRDDDYFGGKYGDLLRGNVSDSPAPAPTPATVDIPPQPPEWLAAYEQMRETMDAGSFSTWLEGATFRRMDGETYAIGVKNEYARDYLQYHMRDVVEAALGASVTFEIVREHDASWNEENPLWEMKVG